MHLSQNLSIVVYFLGGTDKSRVDFKNLEVESVVFFINRIQDKRSHFTQPAENHMVSGPDAATLVINISPITAVARHQCVHYQHRPDHHVRCFCYATHTVLLNEVLAGRPRQKSAIAVRRVNEGRVGFDGSY